MRDKMQKMWLYSEIPSLVEKGIISEESSTKIREYYGVVQPRNSSKILVTIFAILGSLLIGSGLILIIATNWDKLSLGYRSFFSLLPLVISMIIVIYVFMYKMDSIAWKESSIAFQTLSFLLSVALISQTYMIPGSLSDLLLITCILTIPFAYILEASIPVIFHICGITVWVMMNTQNQQRYFYWLLLLTAVPHIYSIIKKTPQANRLIFLLLAAFVSGLFGVGATINNTFEVSWKIIFPLVLVAYYLFGINLKFLGVSPKANIPYFLGFYGTIFLSLFITSRFIWRSNYYFQLEHGIFYYTADIITAVVVFLTAAFLLYKIIQSKYNFNILLAIFPFVTILALQVDNYSDAMYSSLILNLFVFALGVYQIFIGSKSKQLVDSNIGMAIITLLAFFRFVDSDFDLLLKGLIFVSIGVGFLITNILIVKSRKGAN